MVSWLTTAGPAARARRVVAALAAIALVGCAGDPATRDDAARAGEAATCAPRLDPAVADDGIAEAHARAREQAAVLGARDAAAHITRRTGDGYRLRRLTSTLTMAAGFTLAGALLATLLLPLLARRPAVRYGRRLVVAAHADTAALRALGADDDEAPAPSQVARLFFLFSEPLATADRLADRLADLCEPLEHRTDSELASNKLDALYARLERLADALETLRLEATRWREALAEGPDAEVAAAADARLDELGALLEELG